MLHCIINSRAWKDNASAAASHLPVVFKHVACPLAAAGKLSWVWVTAGVYDSSQA